MIKDELIEAIRSEIGGISEREVGRYVAFILEQIEEALERGESVKLTNFGVFETHDKQERVGRNPQTLEEVIIPSRKVVRFRKSGNLSDILNADESSKSKK